MIVYKQGSLKKISLTPQMYIARGGQAEIFGNGNTIYKIYHKQKEAIQYSKLKELEYLDKPNIIRPMEMLINKDGGNIGFTMKRLKQTLPLCKLFTNEVWRRFTVTPDLIIKLVNNMRSITDFIHKNDCLIIDGNEFNYLVDEHNLTVPYFIDVDSYQTPSFPASFIMPSIRDHKAKVFSTLTDWYAFGIIACQLFVGIHPFKGGHPNYKKYELEKRMCDNVSIFNKDVKVPPPTRDFATIPNQYRDWFTTIFETDERIAPPLDAGTIITTQIPMQVIMQNTDFLIKLIREYKNQIVYSCTQFGMEIVKTTKYIHIGSTKIKVHSNVEVVHTPITGIPLLVKIDNNELQIKTIGKQQVKIPKIQCTDMMITDNTLFIKNKNKLIEIGFHQNNDIIQPIIIKNWNIMPNASVMYRGIVYQSILGKAYITIPSKGMCTQLYIPELDNYKIINAKHEHNICEIVGFKDNQYDKMIVTLTNDTYTIRIIANITDTSINFVVLNNKVVVSITDDFMEVYKVESTKIRKIQNNQTNSKMVLCTDGTNVMFFTNNKLYSIKMKG